MTLKVILLTVILLIISTLIVIMLTVDILSATMLSVVILFHYTKDTQQNYICLTAFSITTLSTENTAYLYLDDTVSVTIKSLFRVL